jgi:hypothetical protein
MLKISSKFLIGITLEDREELARVLTRIQQE